MTESEKIKQDIKEFYMGGHMKLVDIAKIYNKPKHVIVDLARKVTQEQMMAFSRPTKQAIVLSAKSC